MLLAGSAVGAGMAWAQSSKGDKLPVAAAPLSSTASHSETEASSTNAAEKPTAEAPSKKPMVEQRAKARSKKPAGKQAAKKPAAETKTVGKVDSGNLVRRPQVKDAPAASEDGLELQQFTGKKPPSRVGEGNAKLSIGEVGKTQYGSFGSVDDPRFADDPLAEPTPVPPIGFKLKMEF
jgi:hypothetical protein